MGSAEMKKIGTLFGYKFYYSNKTFVFRGFWVWTGKRNFRFLALNNFSNWNGRENHD